MNLGFLICIAAMDTSSVERGGGLQKNLAGLFCYRVGETPSLQRENPSEGLRRDVGRRGGQRPSSSFERLAMCDLPAVRANDCPSITARALLLWR